jgi:hypothetical protein
VNGMGCRCCPGLARTVWVVAVTLLAFAGGGGCGSTNAPARTTGQDVRAGGGSRQGQSPGVRQGGGRLDNTDPCAMRLHDLSGALLAYYLYNQKLPSRLEELTQVPGFEGGQVQLTCPVSNKSYVYNPVGVADANPTERVIIYDAEPSHLGMRWAIAIVEPQQEGQALVTKVLALPESNFTLQLRGR